MYHHYTVKELPESEKPDEKCLRLGPEYLSDAELLAVIIRTGTAGKKSIEVAQEILNCKEKNLLSLYLMSLKELTEIPGIGTVKAVQLKCLAEITKRMTKATRVHNISLNSAHSVACLLYTSLKDQIQQSIWLLFRSHKLL